MSLSLTRVYNSLPELPTITLSSPQNMIRKATQIAIPALLLYGLMQSQQADAIGCIGCGICLSTGVSLPACSIPCALCIITWQVPLG